MKSISCKHFLEFMLNFDESQFEIVIVVCVYIIFDIKRNIIFPHTQFIKPRWSCDCSLVKNYSMLCADLVFISLVLVLSYTILGGNPYSVLSTDQKRPNNHSFSYMSPKVYSSIIEHWFLSP